MNKMGKVSTIIGAVVILATLLIFVLMRPAIFSAASLGFVFLLYSEVVFFGGLILIPYLSVRASSLMISAGLGTTIGLYASIVFISSIIFMSLPVILLPGFLVLQILLAVCAAAISLIIAVAAKSRYSKDSKVLKSDAMVKGFVDELVLIREMSDKKATINKLVEAMKYSDTSVTVDADIEIDTAISELKNTVSAENLDESYLNKCIEKMEFLIKKRNLQTRNVKQGEI